MSARDQANAEQESERLELLPIHPPQMDGVLEFSMVEFFSKIPDLVKWFGFPVNKASFWTFFETECEKNTEIAKYNIYQAPLFQFIGQSRIMLLRDLERLMFPNRTEANIKTFNVFLLVGENKKPINTGFILEIDTSSNRPESFIIKTIERKSHG